MATKLISSNLKFITSQNAPTGTVLKPGEMAFGYVNGIPGLYGNIGTNNAPVIHDFSSSTFDLTGQMIYNKTASGNGISRAITYPDGKMQVALDLPNIDVTAATGIMTLTADASYTASSPIIKVVLKNNPASYVTIGSGKISVHDSGYGSHVDISGVDISYYDGDDDKTYYFLHSGNTKTINGNSIYGYGNIKISANWAE